jgi:hypothetical protein
MPATRYDARRDGACSVRHFRGHAASKLSETAAARYRRCGLALEAERIVTSGGLLAAYFAARGLADARCLVLGPDDSARAVEHAPGGPA